MRASSDLDRLDRTTLRLWRVSNVVGWTFAGAVAYAVPAELVLRVGDASAGRLSAVIAAPLALLAFGALVAIVPALVGGMIGDRVYRWALPSAAIAVAAPHAAWMAGAPPESDLVAAFGLAGIAIFIAAATAWDRWRRRPRALRGGPAR